MNSLDLVPYAEHSQKIPGSFLREHSIEQDQASWKLFLSHFIDFTVVMTLSGIVSLYFMKTLQTFAFTEQLEYFFSQQSFEGLEISSIPILSLSYFFTSYFFNHGQTPGMILTRSRISLEEKSFLQALRWSFHSLVLCFSMGLTYLFTKSKWNNLKSHDYLYHDLMSYKEFSPVNLLERIEEFGHEEERTVEWKKAA